MRQLELGLANDIDLPAFFENLDKVRDKNYLTHNLHPYPAKFIPQIPRALIREYAPRDGLICDPMCGSGTALVEAALEGHPAVGLDLNPVAILASSAKTQILKPDEPQVLRKLATTLRDVASKLAEDDDVETRNEVDNAQPPEFYNRAHWFEEHVQRELAFAKREVDRLAQGTVRTVALNALSAVIVGVSNQESETRWSAKPSGVGRGETLYRVAGKLESSLRRLAEYREHAPCKVGVVRSDVRHLPVRSSSVDFIVTSPPYANSHDYYLYHKLRLFWLGYDVKAVQDAEIGSRNKHSDLGQEIGTYRKAMAGFLRESSRILAEGRFATIIVADAVIRGQLYRMDKLFRELAKGIPELSVEEVFQFGHRKYNALFPSSYGTSKKKQTHVLVFRKDHPQSGVA